MDRYSRVLAKYEWADKHVKNFESAVLEFRRDNPHVVGRKRDLESGRVVDYVENVPVIDSELSMKFGDAIHNLRSTLDHLARALAEATGTPFDVKKTSFPVSNEAKDYKSRARACIVGLSQPCLETLDRIQPYKGGYSHIIWQLNELDVIDKHRMLVAVATVPVGRTMTPSEKANFLSKRTLVGPVSHAIHQYLVVGNNPRIKALEAGDELGTYPISESDENMGYAFDIAISEPEVVDGLVPALFFLLEISSEIHAIIKSFASCL
jgi:hypothetical protein